MYYILEVTSPTLMILSRTPDQVVAVMHAFIVCQPPIKHRRKKKNPVLLFSRDFSEGENKSLSYDANGLLALCADTFASS